MVQMRAVSEVKSEYDAEQPVIEAIRAGDRFAFDEFVRRQGSWVRGVVFGVLGNSDRLDDVCQQVWTAVWEQASRLKDSARWRPWLYSLARNAAVDAGRSQTRRRKLARAIAETPNVITCVASAGPDVQAAERRSMVFDAVQGLPPLYREPFVLRHLAGWNYQQISEVMGLPLDTVETRLVRARRLLRSALEGKV
ncbi:MAG: RNA polymerase sigma factor [Phycisphaerales bacterium]|nr:RNA polymerase sigma factor [Phycisphaerales bacterium]